MKTFLYALCPYAWRFSLLGNWLVLTAMCLLGGLISFLSFFVLRDSVLRYPLDALFWLTSPFVPLDFVIFWFSARDFIYFSIVPLVLLLILSGDWAMHKIGIPETHVKILCNLVFLLLVNIAVHMILWHTWKPWVIFDHQRSLPFILWYFFSYS